MNIKFVFCLFSFLFIIGNAWSQVTIGNGNVPAKGALLDMKETESSTGGATSTKGVVFPRVSLDSLTSLTPLLSATDAADATLKTTHKGAVVYNVKVDAAHNLEEGFYYWDAAKWIKMTRSTSVVGNNEWLVSGNGGTNPANNFVGTTDAQPLAFRTGNQPAGYISNSVFGANALGLNALKANTTGTLNTAVGGNALSANQTGGNNTAVGALALASNTMSNNTAVGASALATNTTGELNTAVGVSALGGNTTGMSNIAMGRTALAKNTTGNFNVAVGNASIGNSQTSSNNATLGYNTLNAATGSSNTAVGSSALDSISAGDRNTAIGFKAGQKQTAGSNNIAIGANTSLPSNTGSDQMNIGNTVFGTGMNGTAAAPAGSIGIRSTAPTSTLTVNGSFGGAYKEVSAGPYTISGNDHTITYTGTADATFNLPAISSAIAGRQYLVKNLTSANTLTVSSGSANLRRGGTVPTGNSIILPPGFYCTIIANNNTSGAVWDVMSLADSQVAATGWTLVATDLKSIVNTSQPLTTSYKDIAGSDLTLTIPANSTQNQVIVRWDVWGDVRVNNASGSLRFALKYTGTSSGQVVSIMMSTWASPNDNYVRWTAPVVYSMTTLTPGTYTFTLQVLREAEVGSISNAPVLWGSQGKGDVYIK